MLGLCWYYLFVFLWPNLGTSCIKMPGIANANHCSICLFAYHFIDNIYKHVFMIWLQYTGNNSLQITVLIQNLYIQLYTHNWYKSHPSLFRLWSKKITLSLILKVTIKATWLKSSTVYYSDRKRSCMLPRSSFTFSSKKKNTMKNLSAKCLLSFKHTQNKVYLTVICAEFWSGYFSLRRVTNVLMVKYWMSASCLFKCSVGLHLSVRRDSSLKALSSLGLQKSATNKM